jgi:glucosamine-6-phosphate deaminase
LIEPGSHINSGTRIITLDHITRVDASNFNGFKCSQNSYYYGVSTILLSRIVLLAWGQNKADIIKEQFRKTSALKVPYVFAESCKYHFFFRPISSIRIDPI